MRTYSDTLYTDAQRDWCRKYEQDTSFEPVMEDYEAGIESFVDAANWNLNWFKEWANDTALRISARPIPGADEDNEEPTP